MKREARWLAVAALGVAATASAGPAVWTSEGPYGGSVYRLYVNPALPSVLYAATRGGLFRSSDSGVSWQRKEAGLTGSVAYAYALGMDADAPGTLWVRDNYGHFNRSTDGGDNWALTGYTLASPDGISDVADSPGTTGKLFIATQASGLLVSNDSGASFAPVGSGLPVGVPLSRVAVDPSNPLRILVGTGCCALLTTDPLHQQTFYRSIDGGNTWSGVFTDSDPIQYGNVGEISFGAGATIYAAIDGSLYSSNNDGANWSGPLPGAGSVQALRADPTTANTVLIGTNQGVLRSIDGGITSSPLNTGLTVSGSTIASVTALALHPNYPTTPSIWAGSDFAGMYFSASAGASWTAQNDGLAASNIRALAMFHDASTHRMFAGIGDAFVPSPALYRGNNAGPGTVFSSWAPSNIGLNAFQIRSVTIDPTTKAGGIGSTRLYATGRAANPGQPGPHNGGVYRSLDGGNSWSTIDTGLPPTGSPPAPYVGTVRNLVLDPYSCAAAPVPPAPPCTTGPLQTVYATSNGRTVTGTVQYRVMKSVNGGNSWTSSDVGIPQNSFVGIVSESLLVVPIVIDPKNPQTLYAGTSDFIGTDDGSPPPAPSLQSGVFKSINGGASWTHSSNGLPRKTGSVNTALDVLSLAINPVNPLELWCSAIDVSAGAVVSGFIYHSTDGGANWSNASTGITSADIRAIYVDPANPAIVYAAGGGTAGNPGGVYKSINSGATWTSISIGLPADAALALQVDPVDSTVLYAGTNTGVWSITQLPDADGDGVPDSVENAAPNAGGLAAGDGNGDGILDSTQAKVGSLGSAGTSIAGADAPLATQYFTVSVTPVTGSCAQVVDEQSVYAAYHGNDVSGYGDNYGYPRQLARFEIQNCQKATVKVKFHGSSFAGGYSFRFFGPSTPGDPGTMGWYDFTSRATQTAADTWQLTLDNGQFGSYRPGTANSILFEGGPGTKEGIFKNGFN